MRWIYKSLIFSVIMMACAIVASPSVASAQGVATPIRDPDHSFEKTVCTWKQIQQVHIVMQKRDYSCGAAALATILVYYWGDNVTEDQILLTIQKILTPEEMEDRIKKGLAISDLRRAAVEMGYLSTIGTLTFQKLTESKVPLIVGITHKKFDHFVVYRGVDCDWVYLADPIRGNIRMSFIDFVSEWQKNAALVVAKEDREPPKTSPLTVYSYEVRRGELNKQVIRTHPEKLLSFPGP
jgi:uncharacterized protein